VFQRADAAVSAAIVLQRFGDDEVLIRTSRHLGQMRHRQHLGAVAELAHEPPHGIGHSAADAGVDLVKDERGGVGQAFLWGKCRAVCGGVSSVGSVLRTGLPRLRSGDGNGQRQAG
jgi:hypothetical protein